MREHLRIVRPYYLSAPDVERRIVEYNREKLIHTMLLVGCVLILVALIW